MFLNYYRLRLFIALLRYLLRALMINPDSYSQATRGRDKREILGNKLCTYCTGP